MLSTNYNTCMLLTFQAKENGKRRTKCGVKIDPTEDKDAGVWIIRIVPKADFMGRQPEAITKKVCVNLE